MIWYCHILHIKPEELQNNLIFVSSSIVVADETKLSSAVVYIVNHIDEALRITMIPAKLIPAQAQIIRETRVSFIEGLFCDPGLFENVSI